MSKLPAAPRHHNNFDALRILAAMTVIYGHAHPMSATHEITVLGNSVQALAVKVFFIVSGYLVAQSWANDPQLLRYLAKRSLRIFPGLLLLLLVSALLMGPALTSIPLADYFSNEHFYRYMYMNAALYPAYNLPGLFEGNVYPNTVNGSLWSLPIEFLMYLVLPVVYSISRIERSNRLLVAFTIGLCALSLYWVRVSPPSGQIVVWGSTLASMLDVAPYFFLGCLFAVTRLCALLDPVVALFMVGILLLMQPYGSIPMELALYLVAPYAVLSFAMHGHPWLAKAGRFGDPSYGLYLYGWPVQQCVFALLGTGMSAVANAAISIPIALALAYGSWHLVEKRALAYKPKHSRVSAAADNRSQVS